MKRVPVLLVRIDERARALHARRRIDDLVAVHLAEPALDLVLRPEGQRGRELAHRDTLWVTLSGVSQDLTGGQVGACANEVATTGLQPAGDRQHVHLGEGLEVGLRRRRGRRRRGTTAPGRCACRARPRRRCPSRACRRRTGPRPAPTPSASRARRKISGSRLAHDRPPRRRRRHRGARRCRGRRDPGGAGRGGSKAFETSPSFRPRSRSASSSA